MKRQSEYHVSKGEIIIASMWLALFSVMLMATIVTSSTSVVLASIARP